MPVYNIFIINRAGSLIYDLDNNSSGRLDVEKTFSFPLDFKLSIIDSRVAVVFGERDGIRPGHVVLAVNGEPVTTRMPSGEEVLSVLSDSDRFPINLRFGRPPLSANDKIYLASTFHALHAIGVQLSPEPKCSGIEVLEAFTFKLHCFQTVTGSKFIVVADPGHANLDAFLRKLYELYSDFVLKNPFYTLDMPVRSELFEQSVQGLLERFDKSGVLNV